VISSEPYLSMIQHYPGSGHPKTISLHSNVYLGWAVFYLTRTSWMCSNSYADLDILMSVQPTNFLVALLLPSLPQF
jgi:hypothetical protein